MNMNRKNVFIFLIVLFILILIFFTLDYYNIIPKKYYNAEYFSIVESKSPIDYNNNGIDDFTDILIGAKKEAMNHSKYKSKYYVGGYPPVYEGVCTDVIWRAFMEAGYVLKDMVDDDIKNNKERYKNIDVADPNIDFRRVDNLNTYFKYNSLNLTKDPYDIKEWQRGDIVVFNNHIAIISDKRNKDGIPYIIHNANQPIREEDALIRWYKKKGIIGHYRFIK